MHANCSLSLKVNIVCCNPVKAVLQDLALILTSLALKMKLFLQDIKNLTRKNCKIIFLQDFDQILQEIRL